MTVISESYDRLERRLIDWAAGEDNLRAAVVIGSRARTDHPADDWSDLDVLLFVTDPEPIWTTTGWLHSIGKPVVMFLERTPDQRGYERRVLYEGGLDVDFVPVPVAGAREMQEKGFPPDVSDMFHRGYRFLIDKDGLSAGLERIDFAPLAVSLPDDREFQNLASDFWYHTVWTAKHLKRGEIWWAKSGCDNYLKHLLQQTIEWHARASRGGDVDTWLRGRFLEEWADPRVVEALPSVFAHYGEEDLWRALLATMDLFQWLSRETARHLGHGYPEEAAKAAEELVGRLRAGRWP